MPIKVKKTKTSLGNRVVLTRAKMSDGTGQSYRSTSLGIAGKKNTTTRTRSVTKNADGSKEVARSVNRNLRTGSQVVKKKDASGKKTKTYTSTGDFQGGKNYQGTNRKAFKGANKFNKALGPTANRAVESKEKPTKYQKKVAASAGEYLKNKNK